MFCGRVILTSRHATDPNKFYKEGLIHSISQLSDLEFNKFCLQILGLEHFHSLAAGKWATDMPDVFEGNIDELFYKIGFETDYKILKNVKNWDIILHARSGDSFNKFEFISALNELSEDEFNGMCRTILALDHHYAFARHLAYTKHPNILCLKPHDKGPKKGLAREKEKFLFQLFEVRRNEPVRFKKIEFNDERGYTEINKN